MADQSSNATANARVRHEGAVLKAGEAMLVIALVLIFLLVCAVCAHVVLRQRKKRRTSKMEGESDEEKGRTEIQEARNKEDVVKCDSATRTRRQAEDFAYGKDTIIPESSHDKKPATKQHRGHHSRSKSGSVAELPFSPLCEIGESEPRHELADDEVAERHFREGEGNVKDVWNSEKEKDRDAKYTSWRCSRSER